MKEVKHEKEKEIKGIVRLAGKDIKGEVKLDRALTKIKGIGIRLSKILSKVIYSEFNLPKNVAIGELSDEQLEKLEEIVANPRKYGVIGYLLNRQRDLESSEDVHLIGSELALAVKQDIERNKEMNTWKGFRHTYGQKVRGQRTRSTGRSGMTVGVLRKAILAKAGAAAQAAAQGSQVATAATPTAPAAPAKKEEKPAGKEEKK